MESWNGKPYHSFDYMLKERFSCKIYKTALNGGMTCPNRDGTLGSRGCIFCSQGGSGDFAGDKEVAIMAVNAGNDMLCCTNYQEQIPAVIEAVKNGQISEGRINESVIRILELKISLGLISL